MQKKNKTNSLFSKIPKPEYSFWEIPAGIQRSMLSLTVACAIAMLCCIFFAIFSRSWKPLIAVLLLLAVWIYTIFEKCIPFMYGKVVYFEGVIINQKGRGTDVVKGALAKKVMEGTGKYLFVKHDPDLYKITIPNFKEEYGPGGMVRVYFKKIDCYEKSDHYFIIMEPLLIESLEVNVA